MSQLTWITIHDPSAAPTTPGVYRYMSGRRVLYIGKSVNLRARLKSHASMAKYDPQESAIQAQHDHLDYIVTATDFLALILEAKLIQQYLPPYNRALRDDKSYLYITINLSDTFPKPRLTRARDLQTKYKILNTKYKLFGPFPSSKLAEETLRTIRRLIPFCQQKSITARSCFYSHLGLCHPCPSGITKLEGDKKQLAKRLYRRQIFQIIQILEGKIEPVVTDLNKELKALNHPDTYESALALRDKIARFEHAIKTHSFTNDQIVSYSSSEKDLSDLTQTLSNFYHLGSLSLSRIECYDASTFQLSHSVVTMVVAENGQINPGQYRRFRIKRPRTMSDFDMLEEALMRRLKNKTWGKPDLIVIDGGRPQLHKLQPLLDKLESPPLMVGLAKHPDKIILLRGRSLKGSNHITINLSVDSKALHLLQRLRDEAHRTANNYRKILENKQKKLQ